MKWKTLTGKIKNVPTASYRVDWDGDQGSRFSEEVLDFLFPFWKTHAVLAEYPVAGSKMRFDFVNLTRKIIIETDGFQHDRFSEHFHRGSRAVYSAHQKRDLDKDKIAEINGFQMIRIKPSDLPLTKELFLKAFNVTL